MEHVTQQQTSNGQGFWKESRAQVFAGVVAALVVPLLGWAGMNRFVSQGDERAKLVQEFGDVSLAYVECGKRALIDVTQHHGSADAKSERQKKWEGECWDSFRGVLTKVERACPDQSATFFELKCANTRFYALYDALDEQKAIADVLDPERLRRDCGSSKWSIAADDPDELRSLAERALVTLTVASTAARREAGACAGL
jgi:hypothetical protein